MKSTKESRTFTGNLYEGKDCSIIRGDMLMTDIGGYVDGVVSDFYGKKVKLTITIEIEEIQ